MGTAAVEGSVAAAVEESVAAAVEGFVAAAAGSMVATVAVFGDMREVKTDEGQKATVVADRMVAAVEA